MRGARFFAFLLPMRILQLVAIGGRGGTGASVVTLTRVLVQEGHRVWVVCFPKSQVRRALQGTEGVELITDLNMSPGISPIKSAKDIIKLARLIKREKIEVIHAHSSPDARLATAMKLLFPRITFIRSRHVPLPVKDRIQAHLSDAAVASSFCVKRRLGVRFAEKARVIYDAYVEGAAAKKGSQHPRVINISRFARVKGLHLFVEALCELRKRVAFRAKIVGRTTDKSVKEKMELLKKRFNMHELELCGFTSSREELYQKGSIICLTSVSSEGSSRVAIEASHFGIPVVAHNLCSIGEMVRDKKTGFTTNVGNYREMAARVLTLMTTPKLYKRLSVNSKGLSTRFSKERLLSSYAGVLTRH